MDTIIGAAIGLIASIVGMLLNSWLTQGRERRQQVWQTEVNRIIDLEERAGQLVELIGGHGDLEEIREGSISALPRLKSDAGRFRRHKGIMQAVRDLHNGLGGLYSDKMAHKDCRETCDEVVVFYDKLLAECDKVTGKRRV